MIIVSKANFMYIQKQRCLFLAIVLILINFSLQIPDGIAQPLSSDTRDNHTSREDTQARFMGTATCASSNCHGNAVAIENSNVFQNEFVTWYRHDSHSKAFSVLLNDQSKRIAHNLSIDSAAKDPLCLSCHATFVPNENDRGDKYRVSDGVSCESCHGASSKWLKEHVSSDASHNKNIGLGMTDLSNTQVKSELCLSCHLGNEDKNVNHRLIGAGHPRLTFELDTFESVMPRHWKLAKFDQGEDNKYSPTNTWLRGQVLQAIERTKALYSKTRSHAGLFPEFSNLHCYACHHALSQHQYQSREYEGKPGQANLNTSELWILSKTLSVVDKNKSDQLASKTKRLRELYGNADIATLSQEITLFLAKNILPDLISKKLSSNEQEKIFDTLIKASHLNLQYETAEQIAMGAAAIAAENPQSQRMNASVKELYKALDNPEMFDPRLFKKAPVR